MEPLLTTLRKAKPKPFVWFGVLALIYIVLGSVLPPNAATVHDYHLSSVGYHVLVLFVSLPVLIIWFAAFYGYARLDSYARAVRDSNESRPFKLLARGLLWLAWGLPVTSILNSIFGGIAHAYVGFGVPALVINHYLTLVVSVVAFTFINSGTNGLSEITGRQPSLRATRWLSISFILLAMLYCFATIRVVQTEVPNPYHLPMWLILFTIIMPYLYAWLMGLLAAFELSMYRKQVRGLLYKRALNWLALGISAVIFSSIIIQYLTSSSPYLRRITFNWLLLLVYVILILYGIGFVFIALGASKLKKIEEV